MITGVVTDDRQAIIRLMVRGPAGLAHSDPIFARFSH